jgi:hypothetical protein
VPIKMYPYSSGLRNCCPHLHSPFACRIHHTLLTKPCTIASINLHAVANQIMQGRAGQGQAGGLEAAHCDIQVGTFGVQYQC